MAERLTGNRSLLQRFGNQSSSNVPSQECLPDQEGVVSPGLWSLSGCDVVCLLSRLKERLVAVTSSRAFPGAGLELEESSDPGREAHNLQRKQPVHMQES